MQPGKALVLGSITLTQEKVTMDPPKETKHPAMLVTYLLLPLVYAVVGFVLWPGSSYPPEVKTMVITAIVSGVLGTIVGFWMGTSLGSSRKTDAMNAAIANSTQGEPK